MKKTRGGKLPSWKSQKRPTTRVQDKSSSSSGSRIPTDGMPRKSVDHLRRQIRKRKSVERLFLSKCWILLTNIFLIQKQGSHILLKGNCFRIKFDLKLWKKLCPRKITNLEVVKELLSTSVVTSSEHKWSCSQESGLCERLLSYFSKTPLFYDQFKQSHLAPHNI